MSELLPDSDKGLLLSTGIYQQQTEVPPQLGPAVIFQYPQSQQPLQHALAGGFSVVNACITKHYIVLSVMDHKLVYS